MSLDELFDLIDLISYRFCSESPSPERDEIVSAFAMRLKWALISDESDEDE